jgi:hypothetical protein
MQRDTKVSGIKRELNTLLEAESRIALDNEYAEDI